MMHSKKNDDSDVENERLAAQGQGAPGKFAGSVFYEVASSTLAGFIATAIAAAIIELGDQENTLIFLGKAASIVTGASTLIAILVLILRKIRERRSDEEKVKNALKSAYINALEESALNPRGLEV